LVEKILDLRACEDSLVRSYERLRSEPAGPAAIAMDRHFVRIQIRLAELEQLMTQLEYAEARSGTVHLSLIPTSAEPSQARPRYQA
jgi:hypothetical protein